MTRRGKPARPVSKPDAGETYAAFMSRAYAMELEATDRYTRFADELESLGNHDVSMLFRKLAEIEAMHARQILAEMGWTRLPDLPQTFAWRGSEAPETAPMDALRHPMETWQALEVALRCEIEAQKYFETIAAGAARVRAAAEEMAAEEREHAELIRDWLARVKPQG